MFPVHARGCRVFIHNLRPPAQRWLSGRPPKTYNSPRPGRDDYEHDRRRPARAYDSPRPSRHEFDPERRRPARSPRPSREEFEHGTRRPTRPYSSPRSTREDFEHETRRPPRRYDEVSDRGFRGESGRDQRLSSPRTGPPRTGRSLPPRSPPPRKSREPGVALIPELPEEEKDKIGSAKDIFHARSMYFIPPERPKQPQQPQRPPQQGRNAAAPSADFIKASIQGPPDLSGGTEAGAIVAEAGRDATHAQAAQFFLSPPATFLYSAYRFKQHPINTTTPEICIVGASNCGKSTFVNALTGAAPSQTLAKESDRAGKTVSMNAYGVGSLTGLPIRKPLSPQAAGEAGPVHGMVLVDTPGYGHASRGEWGQEITEYLNKRTMLRGVVLLLSAEKRVSNQDEQIMRLLADAGRPVMVVFTKMDKALRARAKEEGGIAQRLRELERCFTKTGWKGWVPRVHLTAAKMERDKSWRSDPTRSAAGMAGVRIAMLELAGIRQFVAPERAKAAEAKAKVEAEGEQDVKKVEEKRGKKEEAEAKREEPGKALESDPAAWSGDVISFEELEKQFGDWNK